METTNIFTKNVTVSKGDLPEGYEAKFTVTIDYTNVDRSELIKRASAKDIITLQNSWRKQPTSVLNAYGTAGLKIDGATIGKATGGVSVAATLKALGYTDKQIELFVNNPELVQSLLDAE